MDVLNIIVCKMHHLFGTYSTLTQASKNWYQISKKCCNFNFGYLQINFIVFFFSFKYKSSSVFGNLFLWKQYKKTTGKRFVILTINYYSFLHGLVSVSCQLHALPFKSPDLNTSILYEYLPYVHTRCSQG